MGSRRGLSFGSAARGVAVAAGLLWAASRVARRRRRISFRGRVVVITGGSRGLGLVMARQLARQGARLALLARDPEELERAHAQLDGAEVLLVHGDVSVQSQVEAAVAEIRRCFGRIDVLINNAGVITGGPLEHMDLDDFREALEVHLWGSLYAVQAVVPHMRAAGGGRIVNISSVGGRVAIPHLLPYCASKFALVGLSDGLRAELAGDRILVTTVCPGLMRTGSPFNARFKGRHREELAWFAILDSLPLLSVDAERAARIILDGCRHGDAEVIVGIAARLAVLARTLAPELVAGALALVDRLMPPPEPSAGEDQRTGWESRSDLVPSRLTRWTERAAQKNNQVPTRRPPPPQ